MDQQLLVKIKEDPQKLVLDQMVTIILQVN